MTKPNHHDAPSVVLAGRKWPIPELGVRQLRAVRRPLIDLTDAIAETESETTRERVLRLSSEQYEAMCEVVYQGLTRAHPELARDEFLDMTCTDAEILLAFLVVRRQSGVFVAKPRDGSEASTPGEAQAEMSRTGTE